MVMSEIFSPDVMTSNIFGLSETLIIYIYLFIGLTASHARPCQRIAMVRITYISGSRVQSLPTCAQTELIDLLTRGVNRH